MTEQHFAEAERLLGEQRRLDEGMTDVYMSRDQMEATHLTLNRIVAAAQVHATLALAEATWAIAARTGGE